MYTSSNERRNKLLWRLYLPSCLTLRSGFVTPCKACHVYFHSFTNVGKLIHGIFWSWAVFSNIIADSSEPSIFQGLVSHSHRSSLHLFVKEEEQTGKFINTMEKRPVCPLKKQRFWQSTYLISSLPSVSLKPYELSVPQGKIVKDTDPGAHYNRLGYIH